MNIDLGTLRKVITDAYIKGTEGSLDFASIVADEIMQELSKTCKRTEGWKTYSVKELREKKVPTVFQHKTLGACFIEQEAGKNKELRFPDGTAFSLNNDEYPFDVPMREIKDSDYE